MVGLSSRPRLYRSRARLVTLVVCALIASFTALAQVANRSKEAQGPRALALLEIGKDGKGRLFPIAILDNGKFFDGGAYKATPVPMALEPGTVYEGFRSGVSQGLFTVTGAGEANGAWMAQGTWLAAGATPPRKGMKAEMPVIKDEDTGPPKLRRPGAEAKAEPKKEEKPAEQPEPTAPTKAEAPKSPESVEEEDPNRPRLRRGIPPAPPVAAEPAAKPATSLVKETKPAPPQVLLGISDAGGPDPRPYTFDAKPDEIAKYEKQMLDLAAQDVRKRIEEMTAASQPVGEEKRTSKAKTGGASKAATPRFSDIDFRVFDLSNSNEPVWVLTAKARVPAAKMAPGSAAGPDYFVTVACRTDIYGDLRRLLSQVTDARHLDVVSRLELIDAVDADGDGRGELLFREVSDNDNRGYVLYRFTGDTLWKLFDSFGGE